MVRSRFSLGRALERTEIFLDASECVGIIVDFLKTLHGHKDELACKILVWEVGVELAVACELDQELLLARPMKRKPGIYLRSSCWSALKVLAERDQTERFRPICLLFLHSPFGHICERPFLLLEVEKSISSIRPLSFDSYRQLRIMPALNGCIDGTHDHSALLQSQREVVNRICDPVFVRMVNWTE
jgi:hypothetical protein